MWVCRYMGVQVWVHNGMGMQKHTRAGVCTQRCVSVQVHGCAVVCAQRCGYIDTWVCRCDVWVYRDVSVYRCVGMQISRYTGVQSHGVQVYGGVGV